MPSAPLVASRRKFMSWITRSTVVRASTASPAAGSAAPSTRAPCNDSSTSKAVRTASLSSITRIVRLARLACSESAETVLMAPMLTPHAARAAYSHGAGCHRWRHRRGASRRLPRGQLPDAPQRQHASDEVVQVEPRQGVVHRQPVAGRQRERTAGEDAAAHDEAVLDEE